MCLLPHARHPMNSQDDDVKFVHCPECDNEQADMGGNVTCEECGYGPMPTAEDDES